MRIKHITLPAVAAAVALCAGSASAASFTMDFDGLNNTGIPVAPDNLGVPVPDQTFGSAVLGYYNGDEPFDRTGNQDYDTTFDDAALAVCARTAAQGCKGNFPNANSGKWVVMSATTSSFNLRLTDGLMLASASFYYNANGDGSKPGVALYSGNNLIGDALAFNECSGAAWCGWARAEIPQDRLTGHMITRIEFLGTQNKVVFDDITLSTSPIPEPSAYLLLLPGLLVMGIAARRSRRA